jgi:hypothetical protein
MTFSVIWVLLEMKEEIEMLLSESSKKNAGIFRQTKR